jgi:hypothetical protein
LKKLNKALLAEAKKGAKERADALKDLQKELADLEKQAAAARLAMYQKDSKEYLDEVRKRALAEVDVLAKKIVTSEKKYASKGGTGDNADGKLSVDQEAKIATLKEAINKQYFDQLRELTERENQKLFDLEADSGDKELGAITLRYEKEIEAARRAKNETLALALEAARDREQIAKTRQIEAKRLDTGEALAKGVVETDDTSRGAVAKLQGLKDTPDNAKLDKAVIDAEKAKQNALLDIGIEFAKKRLELYADSADAEGQLIALNSEKQINELKAQKAALTETSKSLGQRLQDFDILGLLGVADKDKEDVKKAFSEVMGYVNDFTSQQLEAANQVLDQRKADVDDKQTALDTEIELNKLGFASNVETRRAELEDAKNARAQALKDQQAAQRAQVALETVQQTIGLITASVDIVKGFSKIPIIGLPLGIAAVAALFGFFASAKAKALGATKLEKGGIAGGKRHRDGGNKYISIDGNDNDVLEIEKGEHITNVKSTEKHHDLLEAINLDDRLGMLDYLINDLLVGTGVTLKPDLSKKIIETRTQLTQVERSAPQSGTDPALQEIAQHTQAIRENTRPVPQVTHTDRATIIVEQLPGITRKRTVNR